MSAGVAFVPQPKRLQPLSEQLRITPQRSFYFDGVRNALPAKAGLRAVLEGLGIAEGAPSSEGFSVTLLAERDCADRPESFSLRIDSGGVRLVAGDGAGFFYAACFFRQWVQLRSQRAEGDLLVPAVQVEDWPDFAHRAVLLDVSRDKIPTMDTLYRLVDILAGWRVNQLQLYIEHTFAYRGHEVVWRGSDALTGEEFESLDAYCAARYVELVPNQNSLGHMQRWLVHDPYRRLAECPAGITHPFGDTVQPFSLCPTDSASLELIKGLYDQLLPHFSSSQLNAGLDEVIELGQGRSAAACAKFGAGAVYLDYLRRVHQLLSERGVRLQFWADMLLQFPELADDVPADATALLWGYEAGHPFAEQLAMFAGTGLQLYVCPGTSSWNSFAGRFENMVANQCNAAQAGRDAGAAGYLVTDWGDFGHLQPLVVAYPGLLLGAALAWNADQGHTLSEPHLFAEMLDNHLSGELSEGLGQSLVSLARAYRETGCEPINGSALFYMIIGPERALSHRRFSGLTIAGLQRAAALIEGVRGDVQGHPRAESTTVTRELKWIADLMLLGCQAGMLRMNHRAETGLADLPKIARAALRKQLKPIIAEHAHIWLARNRPGGQRDSCLWLHKLAARLQR